MLLRESILLLLEVEGATMVEAEALITVEEVVAGLLMLVV